MVIIVVDFGIILVYYVSYCIGWLWCLYVVYYSVICMYGFNGLMKYLLY